LFALPLSFVIPKGSAFPFQLQVPQGIPHHFSLSFPKGIRVPQASHSNVTVSLADRKEMQIPAE
jgi:hypothetical protein